MIPAGKKLQLVHLIPTNPTAVHIILSVHMQHHKPSIGNKMLIPQMN